jgi:hypothetical protein
MAAGIFKRYGPKELLVFMVCGFAGLVAISWIFVSYEYDGLTNALHKTPDWYFYISLCGLGLALVLVVLAALITKEFKLLFGAVAVMAVVSLFVHTRLERRLPTERFAPELVKAVMICQDHKGSLPAKIAGPAPESLVCLSLDRGAHRGGRLAEKTLNAMTGDQLMVEPSFSRLPESPEDIKWMVVIDKRAKPIATYSTGGKYLQWIYTITVLDWHKRKPLARRRFEGSKLPPAVKAPGDMYGDPPKPGDIKKWLMLADD